MRSTPVEIPQVIKSVLHIFEKIALERRNKVMVETQIVSLLGTAIEKAVNGENSLLHQAVKNIVRRSIF